MNIPELSTTLANMNLQNQVGVAVLSKALDSTEQSGTSLINMMDRSMELSVNPNIGSNFDMFKDHRQISHIHNHVNNE